MRQSGEYLIGASADVVWRALNDPEVLSQCIDGCQSMTRTADDAFTASVKMKIGPLSAVFDGEVKLADIVPPTSYTLQGSVRGGAAGFGKGSAKVSLSEQEGGTLLTYEVEGNVGGKLAQIGQRLIDGAARKLADDFFAKFSELVAPTPIAAEAPTPVAAENSRPPWIAIGAMIAASIAGILYLLFGRRT